MNKSKITIIILAILCVVLGGGMAYSVFGGDIAGEEKIDASFVKEKIIPYVNDNILMGMAKAEMVGELTKEEGLFNFTLKVEDQEFISYITKSGNLFFPQGINLTEASGGEESGENENGKSSQSDEKTEGNFLVSKDEVCQENGLPIIYFFGLESCSHCAWEHPIIEEVADNFEGYISFHNNMGMGADEEIFSKYSTGGVPTLVLGCKYYRVGSGENLGEEGEKKALNSLICDLTSGEPGEVCEGI